jgi:hypothetical protein
MAADWVICGGDGCPGLIHLGRSWIEILHRRSRTEVCAILGLEAPRVRTSIQDLTGLPPR